MNEHKGSYRTIAKGTAIFGGVQVFQILINVVRGKFIALFLGPLGMGVSALLYSTVSTISLFSSLGLNFGAVRDIAQANESGDLDRISRVAKAFRRIILFTGIFGALICGGGAKWWSEIAFGNDQYFWSFILLSAMIFFSALASGETSLLQGTRRLKDLAQTSLIGSVTGLLVGVPMYYFWGTNGIAPAMVILALFSYLSNRYFSRKIPLNSNKVTVKEAVSVSKDMIKFGIALTITTLFGLLATYAVNWFVRYAGSLEDVGLYQSASSITTQYIGFVLTAMAADYYPRLSGIAEQSDKVKVLVNQQAEMVMLIAAPIVILLLVGAPIVIRILLTKEFFGALVLLRWLGFALFLKAASYAVGYISFAKGDRRVFFVLEGIIGPVLTVIWSFGGYWLGGVNGLGIAMVVNYVVYLFILSIVVYQRYRFRYTATTIRMFFILLVFCTLALCVTLGVAHPWWSNVVGGLILIVCGAYCYRELDQRINIGELIKSRLWTR